MSYRLLLGALALTLCAGITSAAAENRIALVIGNSAYQSVSALPNPANDARAMTELLKSAGFEVVAAPDLSQSDMRRTISDFAGKAAALGRDTVTLVYYAGHGLQVDGENFLVPIDARIAREADVPLQTVRLNDVVSALSALPIRTRLFILDACRNNPFSEINKVTGRGLAIVDAPSGSLVAYSTAPGTEALDGDGANSPFTTALLNVARERGVPIEQALKRVRFLVHEATDNQQTPWESSSLIGDFSFFPGEAQAGAPPAGARASVQTASASAGAAGAAGTAGAKPTRTVESWRQELRPRSPRDAYEIVIREDTVEAYQAYLVLFGNQPTAPRLRGMLERRQLMVAWYSAVTIDTPASFSAFLASYASSDYASTAQRLLQRARTRSLASLDPTPPCLCTAPVPVLEKKSKPTKKEKKEKQASRPPKEKATKRGKKFISDDEVGPGPGPRPVSSGGGGGGGLPISIGIGIGGFGSRGGSLGRPSGGHSPNAPVRGHR